MQLVWHVLSCFSLFYFVCSIRQLGVQKEWFRYPGDFERVSVPYLWTQGTRVFGYGWQRRARIISRRSGCRYSTTTSDNSKWASRTTVPLISPTGLLNLHAIFPNRVQRSRQLEEVACQELPGSTGMSLIALDFSLKPVFSVRHHWRQISFISCARMINGIPGVGPQLCATSTCYSGTGEFGHWVSKRSSCETCKFSDWALSSLRMQLQSLWKEVLMEVSLEWRLLWQQSCWLMWQAKWTQW